MGYTQDEQLKRSLAGELGDDKIINFNVIHSDPILITAQVTTEGGKRFMAKWIMIDKEWKRVEP